MKRALPAVFIFVGHSGSGKTTLIEKLLPELVGRGLQVATIKHAHHKVAPVLAGAPATRPRTTAIGTVAGLFTAVKQRAHMHVHLEEHAAAASAVAPVRPALGNVFLPAEAHAAVSPRPRDDVYARLVDEHLSASPRRTRGP